MAKALHLIEINVAPEKVSHAFIDLDGVRGWWTQDTEIVSSFPKVFFLKFGSEYQNKMQVVEETDRKVVWKCIEGADEWVGTTLSWSIEEKSPNKTILRFTHEWREETDFFASCNTIWGYYMESIRLLCETGKGTPALKL